MKNAEKEKEKSKLSPLLEQFFEIKIQYPEHLLFFRVGDFYEMFYQDAETAHELLGLTLTQKKCGVGEPPAPMCGVPYHVADMYIGKILKMGKSVAICEQMEAASSKIPLIKREVVKIITPGTVTDGDMLDEGESNFLCCVYFGKSGAASCFADISAGQVYLFEYDLSENASAKDKMNAADLIINDIAKFSPSEMLCSEDFLSDSRIESFLKINYGLKPRILPKENFSAEGKTDILTKQFNAENIGELGFSSEFSADIKCASALFCYIADTQKSIVGRFSEIIRGNRKKYMETDRDLIRNLELCETMLTKDRRGSLLWVLDRTNTSMGRRMLRRTIERPLSSPAAIIARLDAVEQLCGDVIGSAELSELLKGICDIERTMSKAAYKTILPRDMKALGESAAVLPEIKKLAGKYSAALLHRFYEDIDPLTEVRNIIDNAIDDNTPSLREGGFIKKGFNEELDRQRDLLENSEKLAEEIAEKERVKTGIKNLKLGSNRVFGYYLEVSKSNLGDVPDHFIRKQTLAAGERFVTEELKQLEYDASNAKEKIEELEKEIYSEVRDFIADKLAVIQKTAETVAALDVLLSFAKAASENNYVRPDIADDGIIDIRGGRHPVIEKLTEDGKYVPNDTYLDTSDNRMAIITGPNMAGKSTFMRTTALIVLMAHLGSFVPADSAKICLVDRIFTRVGASDNLSAGKSTFMVEMNEVAEILNHATKKSLVILDEVGRGTSTSDGIAIAEATAEALANDRTLGCKTLFATHYHELISLEGKVKGIKNYSLPVLRTGDSIRFMHKIVRGGADESFGIEVAKLAGIPNKVLSRAREILRETEKDRNIPETKETKEQLSFGGYNESKALTKLRQINPDEISPMEALTLLKQLAELARE